MSEQQKKTKTCALVLIKPKSERSCLTKTTYQSEFVIFKNKHVFGDKKGEKQKECKLITEVMKCIDKKNKNKDKDTLQSDVELDLLLKK